MLLRKEPYREILSDVFTQNIIITTDLLIELTHNLRFSDYTIS